MVEPYGIRTRKGYTEWASGLPVPAPPLGTVWTVMSYYPPTVAPSILSTLAFPFDTMRRLLITNRAASTPPAGKLFAARGGAIYDVTAGGAGPWVSQAGVGGTTP